MITLPVRTVSSLDRFLADSVLDVVWMGREVGPSGQDLYP